MKFDALIFNSWLDGLKVEAALAEIAAQLGADALPAPGAKLTDYGYADHRSADIDSMRRMLAGCLAERPCHALPWYGDTLVLAHAGKFMRFLDDLAQRQAAHLISRYADADTQTLPFRLASFGDYGGESEVCWKVARGDAAGVLVLCDFSGEGHWWRPFTALATPLQVRTSPAYAGHYNVQVIYRVDSERVLSQLWSRTSHNDGIAYVCAPEDADLEPLWAVFDDHVGESRLMDFAQRYGWVYRQRYGGGADEHYARFAAKDPHLLERVYRHAAARAGSDSGWWLAGML